MKSTTRILGGIAIAGLFGTGSIAPAIAFTRHPGTPEEHRQTEDLNQQQLDKALAEERAASQSGGQLSSVAAPAATAAAKTRSMQQADNATAPGAPSGATTPVVALADPPQALANASVESANGEEIGAVRRVILDTGGKAKTVIVSLLGRMNRLVAIAANQLRFDESRNVVVAQLDTDQIDALPPAPQG